MEHDAFDVLEERVRKAADTLKRLRSDNQELEQERGKLRAAVQELEKRVSGLEKQGKAAAADSGKLAALQEEVDGLRGERQEIRRRVARLVEVLDTLE
jgi:predicted RNase H-like nuclease (RuvC/YqgF family)